MNILLLASPLIIGGIIAAVNSEGVNDSTEKLEAWLRQSQTNSTSKTGWFNRYIINPVLWAIVKFSDWTDSYTHRGLKNGVRVAATVYLIGIWVYLLFAAFAFILMLAIFIGILYVAFKVLLNSNENFRRGYETTKNVFGSGGSGTRTNPATGIIQKRGLMGWEDTDERIDLETGKYQTRGMFGWVDSGSRINLETGKIQKDGLFGYIDTETRVNQETGVIQKEGLIGWVDTDERIDPQSGKHQKRGMIGWVDD